MGVVKNSVGTVVKCATVFVLTVVAFGAYQIGAFDQVKKSLGIVSHYDMDARVVSVGQICRLRGRINGTLQQTQPLTCANAAKMLQQQAFVGYEIVPSPKISYIYFAPDGKKTITGTLSRATDQQGRPYRKGSVIRVRVNAADPFKSRVL